MIYTVTLNPALDKTATAPGFSLDAVNRITELRQDPGGKGINVSKVLAKLGARSKAIAILGGGVGRAIEETLTADGIECLCFEVEDETRTNLKVIDPENNTHTDINEPGPEVSDNYLNEMLEELVEILRVNDIVVLSGSLPRGAASDTYKTWTAACKKAGAKVFLDADGDKLLAGLEAAPFLTKPNEVELGAMLGRELNTPELVAEAARELVIQGIEHVVVSMGGAGAVFAWGNKVVHGISPKVEVGSTVGAGDSVVAALAFAEERNMSLRDTVRLAMATGAANVMQSGTQAADRKLVDSLVSKVEIADL